MRLLDLFCGHWGVGRVFGARGHEVIGIDRVTPPDTPEGCTFLQWDVLSLTCASILDYKPDFIWASSVCDGFASFGMKHFRPAAPYPEYEIKLFNHTRKLCEESGRPYIMENVKSAQQFVGKAVNHAGSFYLWGNAVPPLLPKVHKAKWYKRPGKPGNFAKELLLAKPERKALLATIPPELANCVADYAERLLEQRKSA